jgi:hypothetical protein
MSKYQRWYDQIIERARARKLDIYRERHHIKPRAFGGTDDPENLVDLTYREHFLVHWLLIKICAGRERALMAFALHCMSFSVFGRVVAGWQFEVAKRVLRREYLLRFKYRHELKQEVRREKLRQIADAAARVPERAAQISLKRADGRLAAAKLAVDLLRSQGAQVRRQTRKTSTANHRAKLIIAEANKVLGANLQPLEPDHSDDGPKRSRQATRPDKKTRKRYKTTEQRAARSAAIRQPAH